MTSRILTETDHFTIDWRNGCDSGGIFICQSNNNDEFLPSIFEPQAFIHLHCVQTLIDELTSARETLVIKNRIPDGVMMYKNRFRLLQPVPFVPNAHRQAKKNGGVWGQAYYTPLTVIPEHFNELVTAIKFACSKENVEQLESKDSNDFWSVLDGMYLDNAQWHHIDR